MIHLTHVDDVIMTYKDETLAIHAGYSPEATTKAVGCIKLRLMPLIIHSMVQTLFDPKVQGNIYTRIIESNHSRTEQRLAALKVVLGHFGTSIRHGSDHLFDSNDCSAGDNIASVFNFIRWYL